MLGFSHLGYSFKDYPCCSTYHQYFIPFFFPLYFYLLFIDWWTIRSFPLFVYHEIRCYEHLHPGFLYEQKLSFLLGVHLGVELLGHVANLFNLWGISGCFPEWLHHLAFLPTGYESSVSLLPNQCLLLSGLLSRANEVSSPSFYLHFPMILSIFSCFFWSLVYLL